MQELKKEPLYLSITSPASGEAAHQL